MSSTDKAVLVRLDPTWSASRIANAILEATRAAYGDRLDIAGMHAAMDEIWVDMQRLLSDGEKLRIQDVSHVSVPLGDFNARIATPPSRLGYFILFDAMLDVRLAEIFTAPRDTQARGTATWTAAYVRAAWGTQIRPPHWVMPAMEEMKRLDGKQGIPDSYSLAAARDFIFAHECGHLFLNHLRKGKHKMLNLASNELRVFDPALKQEVDADAFARELMCRSADRPLAVQQMGVDWLCGFMGAVLAMRKRAQGRREGDTDLPEMDEGMALRRALSRDDYVRRRAASARPEDRRPENETTIDRLRQSVDNFNSILPPALADIYAEFPEELMSMQERVTAAAISEEDSVAFQRQLAELGERTLQRQASGVRRPGWGRRFKSLVDRWF